MTDPYEPPRPRDYALEQELESLREQEREGHATPKEQRRAEQLERKLRVVILVPAIAVFAVALLMHCIADFMAPDPGSRTGDLEGRRLELIDPASRSWGWRVRIARSRCCRPPSHWRRWPAWKDFR